MPAQVSQNRAMAVRNLHAAVPVEQPSHRLPYVILHEEETFFFQAIELCSIKPALVSILTLNVSRMSAFLFTLKGNALRAGCGIWGLPLFDFHPYETVTLKT